LNVLLEGSLLIIYILNKMKCPKCNAEIHTKNINIYTDIAQCITCGHVFRISESIENSIDGEFNENDTPEGTWIKKDFNSIIIGASTQSPIAFFLVPFMLVWSGGSIGVIYGTQIINGKFDLVESLIGIPFLIGAIIFWTFTFMAIWGKVELSLNRKGGRIFTGVGNFGLTKRFLWSEVNTINERSANMRYPGSQGRNLVFEGNKRISFGLGVREERRYYLFRAIKSIMKKKEWGASYR